MDSFAETGLQEPILEAVKELGFEIPTPIQAKTIPHLLNTDRDLIAFAQTGTGKTAAFGLPAIHLTNVKDKSTQTIILCPTRELCIQITKDLTSYAKYMKELRVVAVYGGSSIDTQIKALKKGAQIVVGTPGRTKDLIQRKRLLLGKVERIVLDEADEMLTMGFKDELDAILANIPEQKQTLLFSATMSKEMATITKKYMVDPVEMSVAQLNKGADTVKHLYYMVHARDRYEVLKRLADINPDIYGIVFCRTRRETKEVANKLMHDDYNADALHGELSQAQRDEVMGRFRNRQLQILVATDVAARGLDVTDLTHIINYNLPDDSQVYVHRSGRTGRAGKSGISIAIIHTRETRRIREIERRSGIKFTQEQVPSGSDICSKQLITLIDKIEKVKVDEHQIEPFLPAVYEKLQHLSREDLIKHFVSAEFNRFLAYYKNARDINVDSRGGRDRDDRRDRRDRGDRRDRRDRGDRRDRRDGGDRRDRRDGGDRSDRRSSRDGGEFRDRRESGDRRERPDRSERVEDVVWDSDSRDSRSFKGRRHTEFASLFINVGTKNNLDPARLIGLINQSLDSGDARIGKIDIQKKFSIFDIDQDMEAKAIVALNGQTFDGVSVFVEPSQEKPSGADEPYRKSKKNKFSGSSHGKKGKWNRKEGGGKKKRKK